MSWRLIAIDLAALLLAGCGFLNSPKPNTAGGKPDEKVVVEPVVTTRPAESATTQPAESRLAADAAVPRLDPQAYAKVIDAYLNRKAKATSRPAAARIPEFDSPPAAATAAVRPEAPKKAEVQWIEPSTAHAEEHPAEPATSTTRPRIAIVPPDIETTPHAAAARIVEVAPQPQPSMFGGPSSDQLEAQLAKQVKNSPRDLSAELDYQLLQMLRGKQVPQLEAIASLSAEDREVLSALLDALANFRANAHDDNLMISRKIRPLTELSDRLRSLANLRIPTIALCTSVKTFGVYEPVESERFLAGRDHAVMVYCEIENFLSRLNGRNFWETDLTHEAVLYNDRGQRVQVEAKLPVTDLSRNRRRDLFAARRIKLPAGLPIGKYQLVVTITDQEAKRLTEANVPIQIVPEK